MEKLTKRELRTAQRLVAFIGDGKRTRTAVYRQFGKIGLRSLNKVVAYAKQELGVTQEVKLSSGQRGETITYSKAGQ